MIVKDLQMKRTHTEIEGEIEIDYLPDWFDDVETLEYVSFAWHGEWEAYAIEDPTTDRFLVLIKSPYFDFWFNNLYVDLPAKVLDRLVEFVNQGEFVESANGDRSRVRKVILKNGAVHIHRLSIDEGFERGTVEDFDDLPGLFPQVEESNTRTLAAA